MNEILSKFSACNSQASVTLCSKQCPCITIKAHEQLEIVSASVARAELKEIIQFAYMYISISVYIYIMIVCLAISWAKQDVAVLLISGK